MESYALVISEQYRILVHEAGLKEGRSGKIMYPGPLPVGAILKADWDQGVDEGLKVFKQSKSRERLDC